MRGCNIFEKISIFVSPRPALQRSWCPKLADVVDTLALRWQGSGGLWSAWRTERLLCLETRQAHFADTPSAHGICYHLFDASAVRGALAARLCWKTNTHGVPLHIGGACAYT